MRISMTIEVVIVAAFIVTTIINAADTEFIVFVVVMVVVHETLQLRSITIVFIIVHTKAGCHADGAQRRR